MREVKKGVLFTAVVLGAGLLIGPIAAQEAPRADDFASWGTVVSETELDSYRGGHVEVLATSNPDQDVNMTLNGVTVTSGTVNIPPGANFTGSMSILAINTGNNVAMQNTINLAIEMSP